MFLNLKFYLNFKEIFKLCKNVDRMEIINHADKYIKSLLEIKSWEEVSIEKLESLKEKHLIVNVLKYSLLHHGPDWEISKDAQSQENYRKSSIRSHYIDLVVLILTEGKEEPFKLAFDNYMGGLKEQFPKEQDLNIVLEVDISILVQTAYLQNNGVAIKIILNREEILTKKLEIPIESHKLLKEMIAERGYNELLSAYLTKENDPKSLYQLYKVCLKGSQKYKICHSNCGSKGFGSVQNYERCFDLLIEHKSFKKVVTKESK